MANDPINGWIPGRFNRRQLIVGSGAAATMAAALAACGSDKKTTATLTIDGKQVTVPVGATILEAAAELGMQAAAAL